MSVRRTLHNSLVGPRRWIRAGLNQGRMPRPIVNAARTGRNALCPCGSGIKFKKCHGRTARDQGPRTRN